MRKLSTRRLKEAARLGAGLNLDGRYVKQSDIEKIKAEDLAVHVYTVNDRTLANELFNFGVDAVITDTLIVGK
jgi:glycerophosphoryl diester phosphodiesterase